MRDSIHKSKALPGKTWHRDGTTWCDPPERQLGELPKHNTSGSQPEMTLWVKDPGDADGCAAAAGSFVPDLAYRLIHGY